MIIILVGSLQVIDTRGTHDTDDDEIVATVRVGGDSAQQSEADVMEEVVGEDGKEHL